MGQLEKCQRINPNALYDISNLQYDPFLLLLNLSIFSSLNSGGAVAVISDIKDLLITIFDRYKTDMTSLQHLVEQTTGDIQRSTITLQQIKFDYLKHETVIWLGPLMVVVLVVVVRLKTTLLSKCSLV